MGKKLVPVSEAAHILGYNAETLRAKLRAGEIPGYRIGSARRPSWRVCVEEICQATGRERPDPSTIGVRFAD